MKSYSEQVVELMGIINYNGCLILPEGGKWWTGTVSYNSLQEAKDAIDIKFKEWGERIKQQNPHLYVKENSTKD